VRKKQKEHQGQRSRSGGGVSGVIAEIFLQPMEENMVEQVVPCNPWRITPEQISTLQPMDYLMPEQVDKP